MLKALGRRGTPGGHVALLWRHKWQMHPRSLATAAEAEDDSPEQSVRNMGIIAHVDAGKTTTAERFLFLSGLVRHMGDVDKGDTTMDFLELERERGITIQSAAISFPWRGTRINMIDTPGHVDFQAEVERAVRVLDGAVTVLDAVSGVQAQTSTVWRQADRYRVPRIVYMNKMDRDGASLDRALDTLVKRFPDTNPLQLHLPIGASSTFRGMVDVVDMVAMTWPEEGEIEKIKYEKVHEGHALHGEALALREKLIDQLATVDEDIIEQFYEHGSAVPAAALHRAIAGATRSLKGVPILCGSSFKKRGIQPLLDNLTRYLPPPELAPPPLGFQVEHVKRTKRKAGRVIVRKDLPKVEVKLSRNGPLVALAFKVVHDQHRGMIIYCRVYSGSLKSGMKLTNVNKVEDERALNIFRIEADDMVPMQEIRAGDIGAIVGMKHTSTGDTLLEHGAKPPLLQLESVTLAPPVFSCALEAKSDKEQPLLDEAVRCLLLEDPSILSHVDADSGQTLISGMGELHLEIAKDRLLNHYKVPATMGKVQISYRSTVADISKVAHRYSVEFGGKKRFGAVSLTVEPTERGEGTSVHFKVPKAALEHLSDDERATVETSICEGVEVGLKGGALYGFPVTDVLVTVTDCMHTQDSTDGSMRACASQAVVKAVEQDPQILQPVMLTEVTCPQEHLSQVVGDLTGSRKGSIEAIEMDGGMSKVVRAHVPLKALLGYSTALRSMTQGSAAFSMEFDHYDDLSQMDSKELLEKIRGIV